MGMTICDRNYDDGGAYTASIKDGIVVCVSCGFPIKEHKQRGSSICTLPLDKTVESIIRKLLYELLPSEASIEATEIGWERIDELLMDAVASIETLLLDNKVHN